MLPMAILMFVAATTVSPHVGSSSSELWMKTWSLNGGGKEYLLRFLFGSTVAESCSSPEGHVVHQNINPSTCFSKLSVILNFRVSVIFCQSKSK